MGFGSSTPNSDLGSDVNQIRTPIYFSQFFVTMTCYGVPYQVCAIETVPYRFCILPGTVLVPYLVPGTDTSYPVAGHMFGTYPGTVNLDSFMRHPLKTPQIGSEDTI